MAIMEPDQLKAILTIPRTSLLPPARVSAILSSAPFVSIPGTFNARCLSSHSAFPTAIIPNLAFRTGSLERLTLEGQDVLKTLGIKTIFDLRSLKERSDFPEPEIEGIKVIWMPTTVVDETTPAAQAEKQLRRDSGVFSLITMYMDMLRTHATAYAGVLKHVGAHPDEPFLFSLHCGQRQDGDAGVSSGRPCRKQRRKHEHRLCADAGWRRASQRFPDSQADGWERPSN